MPPVHSKLGSKTLHSQSREIVANVCDFMKREARSKDKLTLPVYFKKNTKVQKRVAEATGVSERTIKRILNEREEYEEQDTHLECLARSTMSLSE
jgi:hypothetical protein